MFLLLCAEVTNRNKSCCRLCIHQQRQQPNQIASRRKSSFQQNTQCRTPKSINNPNPSQPPTSLQLRRCRYSPVYSVCDQWKSRLYLNSYGTSLSSYESQIQSMLSSGTAVF